MGGLVEHRERAVRIGQGVEAVRRTPADDTDPVGLGQLIEVDAGEDRFEPLGFVAAEVDLGEQLHRSRPAAGGRGAAHEPLGDGVVAFDEGEACRVQHILPVDRAAGVEPPGDEPDTIVAAAGPTASSASASSPRSRRPRSAGSWRRRTSANSGWASDNPARRPE